MEREEYDLVVIGSGPAGEKGAAQAAYFGKRVALVEKEDHLGGAAANTGTLPSKTLRETALYLSGFRQRGLYGINFTLKEKVTARDFLYRERAVVQSERKRIQENLARHQVDIIKGHGKFINSHCLSINGSAGETRLEAATFLIATGSHPYRPGNLPFGDSRVYDSDTILNLNEIPASMLVAGGGVIGCEYACTFAALGVKMVLVEGRDRLLTFMDAEVSEMLSTAMSGLGVEVILDDAVADAVEADTLQVTLKSGRKLEVDSILAATGRIGNSSNMGLENIGIVPDSRGKITVNEHYQTCVEHVYAAGDVIGFPALASTSMEQARIAMVHAFDLKYKTRLAPIVPYGIYTIPECSMAGETEETMREKNLPFVVGRARYSANARGQIIGEKDGFVKLIFHSADMRLAGVHVIGEQASELVHTGLCAILMNATAELFINAAFNYPTLGDMYKYATYDALGRKSKQAPPLSAASPAIA